MKVKSLQLIFLLTALYLLMVSQRLKADIFFPETAPQTTMESNYTEALVRGKEIYTVNVFQKQVYYVFTSAQDITIINCPFPIKDLIIGDNSSIEVLGTGDQNRDKILGKRFITIHAKSTAALGGSTTIQIIGEKDFVALLQIKICEKKDANKVVNLLDGRNSENKEAYTQEAYDILKASHKVAIQKRETALQALLFNEFNRVPVFQTIRVADSSLCLQNITICNNLYMYDLKFKGKDSVPLRKEDVFVYITNYDPFILSEQKKDKILLYPKEILLYQANGDEQMATITFELSGSDINPTFYSELRISKDIIFDSKINVDLSKFEGKKTFNSVIN